MKIYNKPIFPTLPLLMNTTLTSQSFQLLEVWAYSMQIVFTGTPTGTFKLQGSDDPMNEISPSVATSANPTHWTDISGSSQAVSAAGSVTWSVSSVGYTWVRVVYTDGSSGASTAVITSARFNGKAF